MISDYGSHVPILEKIFELVPTIKTVLEFGTGDYSTSFFMKRECKLLSVESQSYEWYEKMKQVNPNIKWIPDVKDLIDSSEILGDFDLIFVDTIADLRWQLVEGLQNHTNIIVVHDSEQPFYQYNLIHLKPNFKYIDITLHRPWAGVFTDNDDLYEALEGAFPHRSVDYMSDKTYEPFVS
jgi:hypothetical protein